MGNQDSEEIQILRVHMGNQDSEEIQILRVHMGNQDSEEIQILRVHMGNQDSEEIQILSGVRQGDPLSPKLFTATVQEVFKNAQPEEKHNYRWKKTCLT